MQRYQVKLCLLGKAQAWDTVVRFSGLGLAEGFYADHAGVADDESRHLLWCLQRMEELGHEYGCMPAHNLLWEGAQLSSGGCGFAVRRGC